jgi:3-hydroxybutyryl-CoA dehydrogenase
MGASENLNAAKTIAVVGANAEGRRIVLASLIGGYQVVLEDVSARNLEGAQIWIQQQLPELSVPVELLSHLSTCTRIEDAIRDADLIIEAVPDELEMKLELFTIFDKFAKPGAIFVSTSAALSVNDITDVAIFRERCIGMRFTRSSAGESIIELVRTPLTSDETVATCQEVALRLASEVILRSEHSDTSAANPAQRPSQFSE